jgi:hypothetical protein
MVGAGTIEKTASLASEGLPSAASLTRTLQLGETVAGTVQPYVPSLVVLAMSVDQFDPLSVV